jgi:hypothetical protein
VGDLTANFSRSEFKCHDGTPYPEDWVGSRLLLLAQTLEVIRGEVGRSINIISAYRHPGYNKSVGSSDGSQHIQGRAADIKVSGISANALHETIMQLYSAGRLPHLGGLGLYNSFCHVDVRPNSGRLARWDGKHVEAVASSVDTSDAGDLALTLDLGFMENASQDDLVDFDSGSDDALLEAVLLASAAGALAYFVLQKGLVNV